MEFKYTTTFDTYDRDFDRAAKEIPFEPKNLKLNFASNVPAEQAALIAIFLTRSIQMLYETEVEFEMCADETVEKDKIEVILKN